MFSRRVCKSCTTDRVAPSSRRLPTAGSRLRVNRLTDQKREMIGRIVAELEGFKNIDHNHAIIPSLRLFAIGKTEYIDLMSRNTGDVVSSMHSTHLINRRSFEIFEDKIDSRFQALEGEHIEAVVLEITVDRKARLNKFYWVACTPDSNSEVTLGLICSRINAMRLGRPFDRYPDVSNIEPIVTALDNLSCRLLITLNVKPDESENNNEAVKFMTCGGSFTNHGTAPSYDGSHPQLSDAKTGKAPYQPSKYDHREEYFTSTKRGERNDNFENESAQDPKHSFENKMHKLIDTYKSVMVKENFTTADTEVPQYDAYLSKKRGSTPSLDIARTRKKLNTLSSYEDLSPTTSMKAIHTRNMNLLDRKGSRGSAIEVMGVDLAPLIDNPVPKTQFNRQQYELKDYNKSLEIDVQTLKEEMKTVLEKYKQEKNLRKEAEDREGKLLTELAALKAEHQKLGSKSEKTLSIEKEKVTFLESKLEDCLQSNSDLRNKLECREEQIKKTTQELHELKVYDEQLKKECAGLQERVNSMTAQLARSDSDHRNAVKKIGELERALDELKLINKENLNKLEEAGRVNKEQEKLLCANSLSLDRLTRDNALLEEKVQELDTALTQLEVNLNEQRTVHENDVEEAEVKIKNLMSKVVELEDELRIVTSGREEAYREIDDLLDNIDALKCKLNKERKENKRLEEDLCCLEKRITKELRFAKQNIVEGFDGDAILATRSSKVYHTESPNDKVNKVEIIL